MSNQKFPDISVGDFAMDILNDMAKDPVKSLKPALKESTVQSSNAPDISRITVSQDFVSLVTEGKKPAPKTAQKIVQIKESKEDRINNLVDKLSKLLIEAKQLIQELSPGSTTVGNGGGPPIISKLRKRLNGRSCKNNI